MQRGKNHVLCVVATGYAYASQTVSVFLQVFLHCFIINLQKGVRSRRKPTVQMAIATRNTPISS